MLFEWAKEPLSHYPLGSHDYTRIDFSCNILKYECEVLREETELKGDVHPIQCLINAWEWVRWTQLMHLKLRKLLCLDELTIRLVATIRWASILYRVWFQNKQWKRNDHWNLEMKLQFLMWPYHYILVLPRFWSSNCWWSALNWVARNTWTVCSRIRPRTHCYPSYQRGRSLINKILVR